MALIGGRKVVRLRFKREHGGRAQGVVGLRADAKNHASVNGSGRVRDCWKFDDNAVVVPAEVKYRVGHLLIRDSCIPAKGAARYGNRIAANSGRASEIGKRGLSASRHRNRVTRRAAVKRFWADAENTICAQKRLGIFVCPRASASCGATGGNRVGGGICDDLNRCVASHFTRHLDIGCIHRSPKKRIVEELDAIVQLVTARVCQRRESNG